MAPTTALAPSTSAVLCRTAFALLAVSGITASSLGAVTMRADIPDFHQRQKAWTAGALPPVGSNDTIVGTPGGCPINAIYTLMAPTPGSAALAGIGTLLIAVRRRR